MTVKAPTSEYQPGRGYSKADWEAVSDAGDIAPDAVPQAMPFATAFPELAEKMVRSRGPQRARTKVSVTLRLDSDIVERFRASGKGWQTRINEILKRA